MILWYEGDEGAIPGDFPGDFGDFPLSPLSLGLASFFGAIVLQ